MKDIFINGTGCVSPQKTFDQSFLEETIPAEGNPLKAVDPNYKEFVPADMIRRMSRVIKMGIASANICLKDASVASPDAIITGTGMGCIEDTEKFLSNMIRNKEEFLTPTSFIQSTHNTVSAQIALLLKCHNYNFTYVHRGFSFESALLDSIMQIRSGNAGNVLAGGMDEITKDTFSIMNRMGFWRNGAKAGEGSAFFLLSAQKNEKNYGKLSGIDMFYKPDKQEITDRIEGFLAEYGKAVPDIDLFICGMNGDPASDAIYDDSRHLFSRIPQAKYKHLSGEYHTAGAFGMWLAANVMHHQQVPEAVKLNDRQEKTFRNILLYNHYRNLNHSLILISREDV
jgi:3-oxoacyl-[acyl-carrier-protein] synthase II